MTHTEPMSLNLNVRGIGVSPTLVIQEQSQRLRAEGRKIFAFGLGQSPFPVPTPVVSALKLHAHEKDYLPVCGLPALREAVAAFHRDGDGLDARSEGVLVGPGSKELMFLLQLAYYGELLLPSPCWVSYQPQAHILGRTVRVVPTRHEDRWRVLPEDLARCLHAEHDDARPRVLVLNYPGNPDGQTYTADELQALAEVARRYGLIVLSDEIYGRIHHRGQHVSLARFYPERTIVSSGLSKWCGAGGWRLGTMTFPRALEPLQQAMAALASETYTSVSAPIQHAAVMAFKGGIGIERYLWHSRRILEGIGLRGARLLREAGVRVHDPEGAFYLFLDLEPVRELLEPRGIASGQALCETILADTGVALLPGAAFLRPAAELSARLAYVDFAGASALAASETVPLSETLGDDYFERHCAPTMEGFRRLARWVRG